MTRVLLFGRLADVAGWRTHDFEPTPPRLSALKTLIAAKNARLGAALDGAGVQAAVNRAVVRGDVDLPAGCEVAFMPPMSGG